MIKIAPFIKIIRPRNAVMTALAVSLGFWIAQSRLPLVSLALLVISAVCAVGYGNIVNDINDAEADKINHPRRPLPSGEISINAARILAALLAGIALATGGLVSPVHCAGCLLPLVLLSVYAFRLKSTPLAGNVAVSLLVAYPLLYGGLTAPQLSHLLMPAFLAFLLNFSREIVKDIEDQAGDSMHGVVTTAVLPAPALNMIVAWLGIVYLLNMFIPFFMGHVHRTYAFICAGALLPLHTVWLVTFLRRRGTASLSAISSLIKLEMLGGLIALAADRILR